MNFPDMSFPLDTLSEANLLAVVRKTTPESFVRLRQTSKGLNEFAETFSRRIQIHIPWAINLAPWIRHYGTSPAATSVLSQMNSGNYIEYPTEDAVQLCLRPRKAENYTKGLPGYTRVPLKEIPRAFSGFLLKQISYCYDNTQVRVEVDTLMAPEVREKYWNAIGQINIICEVLILHMRTTPWSLIERLNPPIVYLPDGGFTSRETVRVPEATKTIFYNFVRLSLDMSLVPRHIENVVLFSFCSQTLDEPIPLARFTLKAWHAGGTTFSRLQVQQLAWLEAEVPGSEAAEQYLKKCLEQTPYQGNNEYRSSIRNKPDWVIYTAEMLVKNPAGKTALICIRYDVKKEKKMIGNRLERCFYVTLYFLTDPQEFPGGTEAYYALNCCPGVKEFIVNPCWRPLV